jgi:hypothetical protein
LAIATAPEDSLSAVTLFEDLAALELQLLVKLMPALKPSELKPMRWDTAGLEVYVPLWRAEVAKLAPALIAFTIYTVPDAIANLPQSAGRSLDPPGTLLSREQRAARAVDVIAQAVTLALIDQCWKLHLQPGQFYLESENGTRMNPRAIIGELRKDARKADAWRQYCQANSIGDGPLSPALRS